MINTIFYAQNIEHLVNPTLIFDVPFISAFNYLEESKTITAEVSPNGIVYVLSKPSFVKSIVVNLTDITITLYENTGNTRSGTIEFSCSNGAANVTKNISQYGVQVVEDGGYYNWWAVNTGKLAPEGWHVPNDVEIKTLFDNIPLDYDFKGRVLKESGTNHWDITVPEITNSSEFTLIGSGYKRPASNIIYHKKIGNIWSSTFHTSSTNPDFIHATAIKYDYITSVTFGTFQEIRSNYGLSVRLIKDDSINPGVLVDYDGNTYTCVKIGNQVWTKQNLKVSHYNDGTPIIYDEGDWTDTATTHIGKMCHYF